LIETLSSLLSRDFSYLGLDDDLDAAVGEGQKVVPEEEDMDVAELIIYAVNIVSPLMTAELLKV
jgi:hypothetical protein